MDEPICRRPATGDSVERIISIDISHFVEAALDPTPTHAVREAPR